MSEFEALVSELARKVVREELARSAPEWDWLTVRQAAELLDCQPKTIYSKLERGILTKHELDGRIYLRRSELDALIREAAS